MASSCWSWRSAAPGPAAEPAAGAPLEHVLRDLVGTRGAVAMVLGALALLLTRWLVAGGRRRRLVFFWD